MSSENGSLSFKSCWRVVLALRELLSGGYVQRLLGGLNVCFAIVRWEHHLWWIVGASSFLGVVCMFLPPWIRGVPIAVIEFCELTFLPPFLRDVSVAITDFCDKLWARREK